MNNKIQLTVADFEPAKTKTYQLYLEIGSNHYSYAVIDPQNQNVKTISYRPSNIHNDTSDELLQAHFSKTKISLNTQKFTFVPTALFHETALANFTKYIDAQDNEEVCVKNLEHAKLTIIYTLPKLQLDKISSYFPTAEIYPQIAPFYNGVAYAFSQIGFSQLFINFKSNLMEVIIIHQHQFQFYNIFEFQNEEEMVYFLLLAAQENNIKPASTTVKVSGDFNTNGTTFQEILKYFPQTEITDQDSLPLFYQGLEQPVMPRFFSLLALHLCEL